MEELNEKKLYIINRVWQYYDTHEKMSREKFKDILIESETIYKLEGVKKMEEIKDIEFIKRLIEFGEQEGYEVYNCKFKKGFSRRRTNKISIEFHKKEVPIRRDL